MVTIVRRGSRGPDVEQLQRALNTDSSRLAQLVPDGAFGQKTHARVTEFQAYHRLAPDGVVGPLTYSALEPFLKALAEIVDNLIVPPENELAARNRIRDNAKMMYSRYHWGPGVPTGTGSPRIAGKLLADATTRLRQGGPILASIFTVSGVSSVKCLTLSHQAEHMYQRPYTATERNVIDIVSWCGIFALYVYKLSGLKMSSWPLRYMRSGGQDELRVTTQPQVGDIGIVNARGPGPLTNHHFIVTDVQGSMVRSVDGNAGQLMEIIETQRSVSNVNATGGFLSPILSKVLS